jgi:hypothetical protein
MATCSSLAPGTLPRARAVRAEDHTRAPPAQSRERRDLPILSAALAPRRTIYLGVCSSACWSTNSPPGGHRFLRHRGQRPWSGCASAVTTSTSRWQRAHHVQRVAGCCAAPRRGSRVFCWALCGLPPLRAAIPRASPRGARGLELDGADTLLPRPLGSAGDMT